MIKASINLSALKHVMMKKNNKEGKEITGLFIPLEVNHLEQAKNGNVYLNTVAFKMQEPKEWADHIIKHSLPKEVRESWTEEEKKNEPILGNLQSSASGQGTGALSSEVVSEDDDLPF